MRLLHAIRPEETLVCRGQYRYLDHGEPTGQVETWQISRLPNETEIVRASIEGPGINLLTHLQRNSDGRPTWLRLIFEQGELYAAAQYTFEDAAVQVARQSEGQPRRQDVVEIATRYEVDYHPVIAHDYVWRGYPDHARGQTWAIPIFSPNLWSEGPERLVGRALRFSVEPVEEGPCGTSLGEFENARRYEIILSDGVQALAWYDEYGIPLRWTYPEKSYDFVLVDYERPEEMEQDGDS